MKETKKNIKKGENNLLSRILRWLVFNVLVVSIPILLISLSCYTYGIDFKNFITIQDFLLITFSVSLSALSIETEKDKIASYNWEFGLCVISVFSAFINIICYSNILNKTLFYSLYEDDTAPDIFQNDLFTIIAIISLFLNIIIVILVEFLYEKRNNKETVKDMEKAIEENKQKHESKEKKDISIIPF